MSLARLLEQATPGPWGRAQSNNLPGDGPIVKNHDWFDWVATVQVSNTPNWRENASLIALAPDMAQLLLDMADYIERDVVASAALPSRDALLARFAVLDGQAKETT